MTKKERERKGREVFLYPIPLPQPFLYDHREPRNLRMPPLWIMLLETAQKLLEHRVQLHRRVIPPHNRVAEPK